MRLDLHQRSHAVDAEYADGEVTGLRVGVLRELLGEGVSSEVAQRIREAAEAFAGMGAEVLEVTVPSFLRAFGLLPDCQCRGVEQSVAF